MTELQRFSTAVEATAWRSVVSVEVLNEDYDDMRKRRLHIGLANGLTLSVTWGSFSYSSNGMWAQMKGKPFSEQPETVEAAVLVTDTQEFVPLPSESQIMSYVPVQKLEGIVAQLAGMKLGDAIEGGVIAEVLYR